MRTDGAPVCWDTHTKADLHLLVDVPVPGGEFVQVATTRYSYCALRVDGSIVCVDLDGWGGLSPDSLLGRPRGEFSEITARDTHACAIRADGTVACWGYYPEMNPVELSGP